MVNISNVLHDFRKYAILKNEDLLFLGSDLVNPSICFHSYFYIAASY